MEQIDKIHKRQLARFLDYLSRTGQLNPGLKTDIKRVFGYIFEDINEVMQGHVKEKNNGERISTKAT